MRTGAHAGNPCATGLFLFGGIYSRVLRAHRQEASSHVASAEAVRTAMAAAASAVHNLLSGVAVFLIVL
jgi:hypothetical protein